MKITIESTSKLVQFEIQGGPAGSVVPARIWEGYTDTGIPVHCYVTRICPSVPLPLPADIEAQFARELTEQSPPTEALRAIPLRMIL